MVRALSIEYRQESWCLRAHPITQITLRKISGLNHVVRVALRKQRYTDTATCVPGSFQHKNLRNQAPLKSDVKGSFITRKNARGERNSTRTHPPGPHKSGIVTQQQPSVREETMNRATHERSKSRAAAHQVANRTAHRQNGDTPGLNISDGLESTKPTIQAVPADSFTCHWRVSARRHSKRLTEEFGEQNATYSRSLTGGSYTPHARMTPIDQQAVKSSLTSRSGCFPLVGIAEHFIPVLP